MGLARLLGWMGYKLCSEDRRVALANLDIAFGSTLTADRKKQLARESFVTLATSMVGLLWTRRAKPQDILSRIEFDLTQIEQIRAVQAAGRGLVMVIPHLRHWELCGVSYPLVLQPVTAIAEPGVNPHIDDMITDSRRSTGNKIVPPRNALLAMVRDVMRGKPVALFIDVNARRGRGGIWMDFFGIPVYHSVAAAELAIKSKGVIVCCVPRPLPDGRVRIDFSQFIDSSTLAATSREAQVHELSEKCLGYYESVIRQSPELYLWTYKRWKRRPSEPVGPFPFYSKYDSLAG